MRIGVPRETRPGETRVAATPKTVEQIIALGYAVFVETGAGAASGDITGRSLTVSYFPAP